MYSLVLMAALTAGPANVADWHGCHGCWGCSGCWGCCGCWGGCYGCWGGCYGCYGGGSCCGWGGYYGGWGGCWGCYGGCYGSWGCCGGWDCCGGCYGGYAVPAYYTPPVGVPTGPVTGPGGETKPPAGGTGTKPPEAYLNRARVIVDVPSDAKLFIDDQPMKTTSSHRVFSTPALEPGQAYYYIVRVEVMRDGKPVADSKRVIVRAGEEARADFTQVAQTTPPAATATTGLGR
jgi:uncharacterized protein (TIGR03000 family)